MKADLLSLLTAKSMNYEISSGNHDAITSEDIAHFLGTRDLDSREYDFLMAKYTEDNHARSMLFDDIYEDVFGIFTKLCFKFFNTSRYPAFYKFYIMSWIC